MGPIFLAPPARGGETLRRARDVWHLHEVRALVAAVCLILGAPTPPAREVRVVMGTTAEIRLTGLAEPDAALDAAFAALSRVDDAMSLWKPSELTRLNDAGGGRVSPDVLTVVAHALDVAAASSGAFDPTVEPIVRATGGLGGPPRALGAAERRRLLRRVGFRRVRLDLARRELRLPRGTRLDLGGIAKGYAADVALAELRRAGARSGLVDLGGSSLGVFGETLTVDVRDPETEDAAPWASFRVEDAAVASSGGDQRPGHIVDPRTGRAAGRILATTVVARTGIEADALSTAVYVLGADEGLRLLARRGTAGLVLLREHGERVIRTTPGFAAAYSLIVAERVRARE
jgi:FAD:protein FMN transferase